jgi:hypothetical protein
MVITRLIPIVVQNAAEQINADRSTKLQIERSENMRHLVD